MESIITFIILTSERNKKLAKSGITNKEILTSTGCTFGENFMTINYKTQQFLKFGVYLLRICTSKILVNIFPVSNFAVIEVQQSYNKQISLLMMTAPSGAGTYRAKASPLIITRGCGILTNHLLSNIFSKLPLEPKYSSKIYVSTDRSKKCQLQTCTLQFAPADKSNPTHDFAPLFNAT